ncbi:MAG: 4Fe-4S binding protein [Bacteroidales bacterium]|nr:4Fe-4S binding protein [Bacteroidales bacterium]
MNTRYSISFPPEKIKKPIISELIRNFSLEINILNADVSSGKTGKLVVEIFGKEQNLLNGLSFLNEEGIFYRQIQKELIVNINDCIACGSCTGVCFSGALKMSETFNVLELNSSLCVLCGICIKACPLQLISLNSNGKIV